MGRKFNGYYEEVKEKKECPKNKWGKGYISDGSERWKRWESVLSLYSEGNYLGDTSLCFEEREKGQDRIGCEEGVITFSVNKRSKIVKKSKFQRLKGKEKPGILLAI